jgi:hypothetical protein
MAASATYSKHRPRELRRRVVVPARVRTGAQWSDACILNISSRGLLIHSSRPAPEGSVVQILRAGHLMVARVVWCEAARSGLHSDEPLPVEDILSIKQSRPLQPIAASGVIRDRRKQRRIAHDARLRGRAMEFAAVGGIAVALAVGAWGMTEHALAKPLGRVAATLGG